MRFWGVVDEQTQEAVELYVRREDAERFLEDVRRRRGVSRFPAARARRAGRHCAPRSAIRRRIGHSCATRPPLSRRPLQHAVPRRGEWRCS